MRISLAIKNPDSKPTPNQSVLYLGEKNTLDFVFTKKGNGPHPGPHDTFTIIIPKDLLASASPANLGSSDWTAQVEDGGSSYTFNLQPKKEINFDAHDQITIQLINLEGRSATNDTVSTKFKIRGRRISGTGAKLVVTASPDQPKDLHDAISFSRDINLGNEIGIQAGQVYISPIKDSSKVAVPVANTIQVNLKLNTDSGHLVDHWPGKDGKKPKFIFSFSTGTSDIDLTNAFKSSDTEQYDKLTSAWNIMAEIGEGENSQWNLTHPNQTKSKGTSPTWVVEPQPGNLNLFSDDAPNLDIVFSHVISILPPTEGATLYIQWANIPGYNDGFTGLNLPKQSSTAQIISFDGPPNTPKFGDPVNLSWKTFAVPSLKLGWDDESRSIEGIPTFDVNQPQLAYEGGSAQLDAAEKKKFIIDKENTTFSLFACDAKGKEIKGVFHKTTVKVGDFPAPTIKSFTSQINIDDSGNAKSITLNWLAQNLGNNGYLQLNGTRIEDGKNYNGFPGTRTNTVDHAKPIQLDQKITAFDPTNQLNADKAIVTPTPAQLQPVITSYSGTINRDSNGMATHLVLNWHVQNAVKSASDSSRDTVCSINGAGQYKLDDNGKGTASIPISKAAPIVPNYALSVSNPNGGETVKILKVDFQKTGELPSLEQFNIYNPEPWAIASDGEENIMILIKGTQIYGLSGSQCVAFNFTRNNQFEGSKNVDYLTPPSSNSLPKTFYRPMSVDGDIPQPFALGFGPENIENQNAVYSFTFSGPGLTSYLVRSQPKNMVSFATYKGDDPLEGEIWGIYPPTIWYTQGTKKYVGNGGYAVYQYSERYGLQGYLQLNYEDTTGNGNGIALDKYPHHLSDIAIAQDGTIYIADTKAGKVWYVNRNEVQGQSISSLKSIDISNVVSIAVGDDGWVYCLQQKDGDSVYMTYFKSGPSPALSTLYVGGAEAPNSLVVATNFFFQIQHEAGYVGVFSGTTGDVPPKLIRWTTYSASPAGVVMIPDNTRFYIARKDGVDIWEAKLSLLSQDTPTMVLVQGGTFKMGSDNNNNEKPIHKVTLPSFRISKHLVTFDEYDYFCIATARAQPGDNGWGRGKRPVINVSWQDAKDYCEWLRKITGKKFRLPTEAEWEYAAKGGALSQGYTYAGSNDLKEVGWYDDNASETQPVGLKKPNELGLYDMSGNVWEWCEDAWHDNYDGAPTDGSSWGSSDSDADRVDRGGTWYHGADDCTTTYRDSTGPSTSLDDLGFRIIEEI